MACGRGNINEKGNKMDALGSKKWRGLQWLLLGVITLVAGYSYFDRMAAIFDPDDRTFILGWDDSFYFFWLRSVVIDGDVDFENEINAHGGLPEKERQLALSQPKTATGLIPNKFPIGWAVSGLPFYIIAHGIVHSCRALGIEVEADGYAVPYQLALKIGHGLLALISLWLAYKVLSYYIKSDSAKIGVIAGWAGSGLIAYQTRYLSMTHSLVFLYFSAAWVLALRLREEKARGYEMLAIGLVAGLLVITRPQAGLYLLVPAWILISAILQRRLAIAALIPGILGFVGVLSLQTLAWKWLYGEWLTYAYAGEGFNWGSPALSAVLFSTHNGLFYWHPILILGCLGMFMIWRKHRAIAATSGLIFIAVIYLNAAWHCWWYGASFGHRAFEGSVLFGMLGLGYLHEKYGSLKYLGLTIKAGVAMLILWNLNLLILVRYWKVSGLHLGVPSSYAEMLKATIEFWGRAL